jgi:hypothetical protein
VPRTMTLYHGACYWKMAFSLAPGGRFARLDGIRPCALSARRVSLSAARVIGGLLTGRAGAADMPRARRLAEFVSSGVVRRQNPARA